MTIQFLARENLQRLLDVLRAAGYQVVGPQVKESAIVYDELTHVDELPLGYTDQQSPGQYRLLAGQSDEYFGYVIGPHAWKKYLFPPSLSLMRSKKTNRGWQFEDVLDSPRPVACLGVRACELAAIAIQDRVFLHGPHVDNAYAQRRQQILLIAVNCAHAATTCFCTSMHTGPEVAEHFDIALTEISSGFTVQVGTDKGQQICQQLPLRPASDAELALAQGQRDNARREVSRHMDTTDIHDKLLSRLDHPQWDDVASRCLSCANCTLVCPTCFCHSVEEVTDLVDESVLRERHWDSCFNFDFSHIAGGAVRPQIRSRYRQWLTHKLATWIDQFDVSGCVGCGRCLTWCPVGIDLTEEVAKLCS